jgi:hypothetical protein
LLNTVRNHKKAKSKDHNLNPNKPQKKQIKINYTKSQHQKDIHNKTKRV